MLDTRVSLDFAQLLSWPAILELDAIGDDDEKAFVGLIFLRIAEALMLCGSSKGKLRHLTVVEEAHRLFQNVPMVAGSEAGNPRGKAVETFCNILSEIRVFGEGVLVVDQIPTRLAPDAIKNTNLKIMHRLPSQEDREVLGHTMALSPPQISMASALSVGRALIYSGGQDESFEVDVPEFQKIRATTEQKTSSDKRVAERMASLLGALESHSETRMPSTRHLRALENDPEFREQLMRFLMSRVLTPGDHRDVLTPLVQHVARRNPGEDRTTVVLLLRACVRHALEQIGLSAAWPFDFLHKIEAAFLTAFDQAVRYLSEGRVPEPGDTDDSVRLLWDQQANLSIYPFPECSEICPHFTCRHRWGAGQLAQNTALKNAWNDALASRADIQLWSVITNVVDRAVERGLGRKVPWEYRRQYGMCFAIQRAYLDDTHEPAKRARLSQEIMHELDKRHAGTTV